MEKQTKFTILIIGVIILATILILMKWNNTFKGLSKNELEQKGYKNFGYDYCTTDHSMECGGDAFTDWTCKICATVATNPDTNVPELCNNCAKITGRCNYCGKLKK